MPTVIVARGDAPGADLLTVALTADPEHPKETAPTIRATTTHPRPCPNELLDRRPLAPPSCMLRSPRLGRAWLPQAASPQRNTPARCALRRVRPVCGPAR